MAAPIVACTNGTTRHCDARPLRGHRALVGRVSLLDHQARHDAPGVGRAVLLAAPVEWSI
jgi:hypothetical protein